MAVRRERVVLELEDRFTSGIARAAAATALYKKELQGLSGTNVSATRTGSDLERQTIRVGDSMDKGSSDLDKFTGRAKLLANVAAALGPSLVPIGAVAVPAITGLASSLGFAAVGVGTAVFAFQGLGDALKAMNDAALDPTEANLEKVRAALAALSPEAAHFAYQLHQLAPIIADLRAEAGVGLFSGLSDSADDLEVILPRLAGFVRAMGIAMGDIASDVTGSLASGKWDDFLLFLETEGPQALGDFATATGNTAHALAELWMATTPLNRDFSDWLVRVTDDFDNWASKLSETDGFKEFIAYIEETGPQVADTLGALGNAILQIVEAAAPIAGPVLHAVESLANAVATIADSPIGTPLMGLVTAMSALRLATGAQAAIQDKTWGSPAVARVKGYAAALTTVTSAQQRATMSASQLQAAEAKRNATAKQGLTSLARGASTLGLLAVASTGVADKFGLTNTASLALAGSFAGPWGAAVGGAIGLVSDLNSALGPSAEQMDAYTQRILTLAGPDIPARIAAVNKAIKAQQDAVDDTNFGERLGRIASVGLYDPVRDQMGKLNSLKDVKKQLEQQTKLEAAAQEYANSAEGRSVIAAQRAVAAQTALKKSSADTSGQFLDFSQKIDDAKVSLNQWVRQMEINADALIKFGENAAEAGRKGVSQGLIEYLRKQGPAGALRMRQLANATEKEIARANRAWHRGQDAAVAYGRAVGAIPPARIRVLGAAEMAAALKRIRTEMASIKDKTVRLNYYINQVGSLNKQAAGSAGQGIGQAEGGTVPGQRQPYGDKTLIYAAPGEEIITNRNGEADRFRRDRAAGRIPAYALGGTVAGSVGSAGSGTRRGDSPLRDWLNGESTAWTGVMRAIAQAFKYEIPDSLKDWRRAMQLSTRAVDRERAKRDELVQRQGELVSAVAEKLRSDLFTSSQSSNLSVWLSAKQRKQAASGDVFSTLRGDISQATAFKKALATLKKKGLDGAAFANVAASGDLNQVQALAAMSATNVRKFEWLYNRRQQLTQDVGSYAGSAAYGAQIKEQTAHLRTLIEGNRKIESRLYHLERYAESNPDRVGASVGKSIRSIGGRK